MSYKSLTINERYNILKEFGKIEKENTDALIQWRNDMSLLSQKQFQKMLQYNQYVLCIKVDCHMERIYCLSYLQYICSFIISIYF